MTIQTSVSTKFYTEYVLLCVFLCVCVLGACQGAQENVTKSSPSVAPTSSTDTLGQGVDEAIADGTVELENATTVYSPTIVWVATPAATPDSVYRLTAMSVSGTPWWSADSSTLFFSDGEQQSRTWRIDLKTRDIEPAPQVQSPYAQDFALLTTLVPSDVSPYAASVSPLGNKIIFSREVTATGPPQEACDGKSCWTIPANEVWIIDVRSERFTRFESEGELVASSVDFRWSDDESRVLITLGPGFGIGSDTPSVWIANTLSKSIHPLIRDDDETARCLSISPNGEFLLYNPYAPPDYTEYMYLWRIDAQEKEFLPSFPCTSYLWLSDSRRVIYHEEEERQSAFWLYNIMTHEKHSVASSTTLPDIQSYTLAPDERSMALVPWSHKSSGIWIVEFDLPMNDP